MKEEVKKIPTLLDHYTNVKPASFIDQPPPPVQRTPDLPLNIQALQQKNLNWLNKVNTTQDDSVKITWSSHFQCSPKTNHLK